MNKPKINVEIFVHFDDCDPAGILFFPNYFRMSERAWELALVKSGLDWDDWYKNDEWGVPLKAVQAEYHAMLRPGQTCNIGIGIKKLGDSSVCFLFEFHDSKATHCASIQTTHVFVDKRTLKKRPIPDHLREFLEKQKI